MFAKFRPPKSLWVGGLIGIAAVLSSGRTLAQQDNVRAGTEFFENKIRPVLVERCFKCHSAESKKSKGGLKLDTRGDLLKGGASGRVVIPGNPEGSLLIRAIRRSDGDLKMPPGATDHLSAAQIQDFVAWVKMGLPFPSGADISKATVDLTEARRFRNFLPLKDAPLPKVKQTAWPQGSIDHFVLAQLEKKGLQPSPPADKRTLLRRATYDLTGLPPTPEEIDAFLADTSSAAFAKVVDQLLASPQYGVQWGRHWLDVARYGDTRWVGAGEDRRYPFAYTYRDWVIRAFNEDMPYDRFVTLQLAADQLPGAPSSDRAALGFLTVGRWFTGNIHDVIDDQIDVVTRGLMGMTVQCARCHDHKYDPISTKDYYSLYGLFAASRLPVDGTGLVVELPEIEPRPVDPATEKALALLREQYDHLLSKRQSGLRDEFRPPEKMAQYLLAAESVVKKTDKEVRELAKTHELNEPILFRWYRLLQRTVKNAHPIFGPLHAFAALSEADFAAKAGNLAEQQKSNKMLNRHVAALLAPPPASLTELARRYAQLLAKFDAPEPSSDADQEMLRQVLRGNDSPVQVQLGELGQYMTKDENARLLQMRRALLARQGALSERADQYLASQYEVASAIAEVNEFLQKRRAEVTADLRAPEKIAEYLLGAREAQGADETKLKSIMRARKLNDRLLQRWIAYLQSNAERNDAVFAAWRAFALLADKEFTDKAPAVAAGIRTLPRHKLVAEAFATVPASLREVALRYGGLIARFSKAMLATDPDQEQVSAGRDSPLAFEADEVLDYFSRRDVDELRNKENKLFRLYMDLPGAAPRAMMLRESPRGYAQKVFVRGNPNVLGADAHGRFLGVLSRDNQQPFQKGKGRWQLAQAIVDPANPLTPRVMVNRVWQWHFGTGLIGTPSDLGVRGEAPSHSELLDGLARQFISDGWSLKKLHRRIMLAATYQQSSQDNPACRTVDPENRLLWRMSHRRLNLEEIRDSLLATAGRLDDALGGRSLDLTKAGTNRRTVYGAVDRNNLPGFYRYFDFPSADAHVPGRHETTIPQQALYMMNNAFVMDQASHLARRTQSLAETPAERIAALYRLAYGRRPSPEELSLGLKFLASEPSTSEELSTDPWRYGYGSYSEHQGRVVDFEPLPFFANGQWRGGPQENDPFLGRCSLHARGGNAGRDRALAVIRRWIAPRDGKLAISGTLSVQPGSLQPSGDGARGRIVSSRGGSLGSWLVHGTEEPTNVAGVAVKRGDTIDFVVYSRGRDGQGGGFTWAPVLHMDGVDVTKNTKLLWDAAKDFTNAAKLANSATRFGTWERYAQVLLEANEYLFLD